ncbi:enoyl-CoA hydratase/isomerase family protein [Bacillus sp. CGMCC 1.16607]|uniref:enoyl-CoA hydratase/isomerase family protein n=1 Tax=Bacillus sp. CGMCC 1.16607 TaxID=3351842 RepID=UPI00363782AE
MPKELYIEKTGSIATLIINRPDKKNAFTLAMFEKLPILIEEVEQDSSIKVLIIKGIDQTAFSAGADITEFLENRFSEKKAKEYNDKALYAVDRLYRFSKPTIAVIQRLAVGGGLELSLACDFRFASDDSLLGIQAAKLGFIYNLTSTKRLLDTVGPSKTKELLFSANLVDAKEALRIGLIDYVQSSDEIQGQALQLAEQLAERSTVSTTGMKKVIQSILDGAIEEDEAISSLILKSFHSEDYKDGIQAFLEERKPQFK